MAERKRRRTSAKTPSRMYQVFVSHASTDEWIAKTICEKIERAGARSFLDKRDIASGDEIPDEIWEAIRRSQEFLVLLTPDSVDRPWVLLEIGMFLGRRKNGRIIAVRCHVDVDRIPDMIKSKKAISINDVDDYLADLAARVRAQQS